MRQERAQTSLSLSLSLSLTALPLSQSLPDTDTTPDQHPASVIVVAVVVDGGGFAGFYLSPHSDTGETTRSAQTQTSEGGHVGGGSTGGTVRGVWVVAEKS